MSVLNETGKESAKAAHVELVAPEGMYRGVVFSADESQPMRHRGDFPSLLDARAAAPQPLNGNTYRVFNDTGREVFYRKGF